MKVIRGLNKNIALRGETVVTIGAFDGLHTGHQKIIREVLKASRDKSLRSALVTFDPHPSQILSEKPVPLLLSTAGKIGMIKQHGIDFCLIIKFTKKFSKLSPEDFARKVLYEYLRAKLLIVGFNYVFGKGKTGDVKTLARIGKRYDFNVKSIEPVIIDGEIVSSTRIRELLKKGELEKANSLLGRAYQIRGTVRKGEKRSFLTRYKTANLGMVKELLPSPGVYAGTTCLGGRKYRGALNLGFRPTFAEKGKRPEKPIPEIHIVGFNGNIYGRRITFDITNKIRDEIAFSNAEELKEQIRKDLETLRNQK